MDPRTGTQYIGNWASRDGHGDRGFDDLRGFGFRVVVGVQGFRVWNGGLGV